jgi:predicted transcriptional regulator
MTRLLTCVVIVFAITAIGFVAPLPAQQTASMQTELLTEVRLLRQAIQAMVSSNARVQIVFGRLTLQEQRTANAARRLDEARLALAKVDQQIHDLTDQAGRVEEAVNDPRRKPEEIEQIRAEAAWTKRQLERVGTQRQRLIAEEAEAAAALNQEQGRWSDLNRQLEEIERAVAGQQ